MRFLFVLLVLPVLCFAQIAPGDIIITEFDADTIGSEPANEFCEITNVSQQALVIDGLFLDDEDGGGFFPAGTGTTPIPTNTIILNPGEAAVFIPATVSVADFTTAWATANPALVFPVDWNGLQNLSNSPSATNEILRLVDAAGTVIDEVNYDDDGTIWPSDNNPAEASIYLLANAFDAVSNDNGQNWRSSMAMVDGAVLQVASGPLSGGNIGSPGFAPTGSTAFAQSLFFDAGSGTVNLSVTGGMPGNQFLLAIDLVNGGTAPNGWFFGIDIGINQLVTQINTGPPFFGILDGAGSFILSLPVPGALGVTVDSVALEFGPAGLVQSVAAASTTSL